MNKTQIFSEQDIKELHFASRNSARLRANVNFHSSFDDPFQRLLISMQPGSYVPPHRHLYPSKPESFIVLKGTIGMFLFTETGEIESSFKMGPNHPVQLCDIPPGTFHTVIAIEPDTLFYEAKPGPYTPIDPRDLASWKPDESALAISAFLTGLQAQFQ